MVAILVGAAGGAGGTAAGTVGAGTVTAGGWSWLNARAAIATTIAGKTTARVICPYCFLTTGAAGGLATGFAGGASSFTGCTWSYSFTMSSVIQVAAAAHRTGDCWSP